MLSSRNNVYRDQIGELDYAIAHGPRMTSSKSVLHTRAYVLKEVMP